MGWKPSPLIVGALLFSATKLVPVVNSVAIKWGGHAFSSESLLFCCFLSSVVFALVFVGFRRGLSALTRVNDIQGLGLYATTYALSAPLFLLSVRYIPLSDAVVLYSSSPLIIPFFERFQTGAKVSKASIYAAVLGFMGVLLVVRPGHGMAQPLAFLAFASAIFSALRQIFNHRVSQTNSSEIVGFYTYVVILPLMFIGIFFSGIATPGWQEGLFKAEPWMLSSLKVPIVIAVMAFAGFLSFASKLLRASAYRRASATFLAPFNFTSVLFAIVIDWALWGVLPHSYSLLGIVLITAAILVATRGGSPKAVKRKMAS